MTATTNKRFHGVFLKPEDMLCRCTVDARTGCWLWTATKLNKDGYARFKYGGVLVMGHRFSYELKYGPVPDGLELDHIVCDTRHCINPDHVKAVTHAANVQRHKSYWRKQTHCVNQHELSGTNLRIAPNGVTRLCRQCGRDRAAQWRAKKGAALAFGLAELRRLPDWADDRLPLDAEGLVSERYEK